jgi:hypothetical protein
MGVHLVGVVCVEAFRFFGLGFGKKSLIPTVRPLATRRFYFLEFAVPLRLYPRHIPRPSAR